MSNTQSSEARLQGVAARRGAQSLNIHFETGPIVSLLACPILLERLPKSQHPATCGQMREHTPMATDPWISSWCPSWCTSGCWSALATCLWTILPHHRPMGSISTKCCGRCTVLNLPFRVAVHFAVVVLASCISVVTKELRVQLFVIYLRGEVSATFLSKGKTTYLSCLCS